MDTTTFSDFRRNLKHRLDKVYEDRDVLLIKRSKGKDVVIISLEDYNSMNETAYLLSTSANAKRLQKAVDNVTKQKNLVKKDLDL